MAHLAERAKQVEVRTEQPGTLLRRSVYAHTGGRAPSPPTARPVRHQGRGRVLPLRSAERRAAASGALCVPQEPSQHAQSHKEATGGVERVRESPTTQARVIIPPPTPG